MNTTRKHIVDWVESRSDRIAKHIELRGDQAINYAVGEMIEQCIADILPKIKADAVNYAISECIHNGADGQGWQSDLEQCAIQLEAGE